MIKENFHLFDKDLFDKSKKHNFAYFLAAAVVLDSDNFAEHLRDKKWTQEDEFARDWLKNFTVLDRSYFNNMQLKKFDQDYALSLGFMGNLRRDYKQYRLSKHGNPGLFGVAVVVFQPQTMFDYYGHEKVCSDINKFMD